MEGGRALHAKNGAAGGRWDLQKRPIVEMITTECPHPWADAAFPPSCLTSHIIPILKVCGNAAGTSQAVKHGCGLRA